jgi:methyl-accepting chemotaxis protein
MDGMMANSRAFAPLTADAAHFITVSVSSIALLCSLVLVLTTLTLRRRTLQPLALAIQAAERVASGDLTGKLQVEGDDESALLIGPCTT